MNQTHEPALSNARRLIARAESAAGKLRKLGTEEDWEPFAEALELYLTEGTYPGGALALLLEGNLFRLVRSADNHLRRSAIYIATALQQYAPRESYGLEAGDDLEDWIEHIQQARQLVRQHPTPEDD